MDLRRYPELIDRLAAEYVLGLLRGGARRRFERLAGADSAIQAAIDVWSARIGGLAELAPAIEPPTTTWDAIERQLGLVAARSAASRARDASMRARPQTPRWFESLVFWRNWSIGATGAALAAAIALALTLRPFAPVTPPPVASAPGLSEGAAQSTAEPAIERVSYVAALADVKTRKTMVFVMWDDESAMMSAHRMAGGDAPPPGKSEQLWGIPEHGQPVSLGMLPPGKVVRMKVRGVNAFVRLAVSVEPPGGSLSLGPSGPVVCAGKLMATI